MAKKVVEKKNTKKVEKKTEVVKTDVAKKKPSKNLITAIIIAAVAILFIVLSFVISKEPEKVEYTLKEMDVSSASKTIQDWYNDLASGDTVVSVLASSNCQFCQALKPVITSAAEKYKFKLHFVEANQLTEEDYDIYSSAIELVGFSGSIPYTYIVSDKKFVDARIGAMAEEDLIDFLSKNGVIEN